MDHRVAHWVKLHEGAQWAPRQTKWIRVPNKLAMLAARVARTWSLLPDEPMNLSLLPMNLSHHNASQLRMVWSGTQYPRNALSKGRNVQEISVRDTSVGDELTLHPLRARWGQCPRTYFSVFFKVLFPARVPFPPKFVSLWSGLSRVEIIRGKL
jgi:hypothetical protein